MVMIKDSNGKERFSVSEELYNICKRYKEKMVKDDSMVLGIFWGAVGCGKSVAAQHWGYVIDPTLENQQSRVCFDKDEFINAIIKNKQNVIIGDEGISLFFSRNAMTKDGRIMSEIMDQIRQKNLCVFICVPKLLNIDSNIIESANFVAYVWETRKETKKGVKTIKGNIALYPEIKGMPYKTKIVEYLRKKKRAPLKPLTKPKPLHYETGNPKEGDVWYPVGKEGYLKKKNMILKKYEGEEKETKTKRVTSIDWVLGDALIKAGTKQNIVAKTLNCTEAMVSIRAKHLKNLTKKADFPSKSGFGGLKLA